MATVKQTIEDAWRLIRGRVPGQLVIQITDQCNARCPQCGMRVTEAFSRSRLRTEAVYEMIDAAAKRGVRAISFTGGEPFLFKSELIRMIRHAGAAGIPFIRTGTNGFMFAGFDRPGFRDRVCRLADALADTPLRNLWISIDSSVPRIHETMRGFPGVIRGIERALPIFHDRGIFPAANLGINRNIAGPGALEAADDADPKAVLAAFRSAFRRFYGFVRDLGFSTVNACYPMSVDDDRAEAKGEGTAGLSAVYAATTTDRVVRFSRIEKAAMFQALLETIPEFRGQIRIFTPMSAVHALWRTYSGTGDPGYPCRGGIDFFFIDARDGTVYPCGYRGDEPLGPITGLDPSALDPGSVCYRCDWECFRDPTELIGPLIDGLRAPWRLAARWRRHPGALARWVSDLRYYRACDFFDGRRPPDPRRLAAFDRTQAEDDHHGSIWRTRIAAT